MRPRRTTNVEIGDGLTIALTEEGQGAPLLFLHGVGSGSCSWQHQLSAFGKWMHAMAWDAPGYGMSTNLPSPVPQVEDYADMLDALLVAKGIEHVHLVGHSMGALIGANYARRFPNRLASLTLASIAPGHRNFLESERLRLRQGRLSILDELGPRGMAERRGPSLLSEGASSEMRRAVVDVMASIHPKGYRQAVFMLSYSDTASDLTEISRDLPTMIIVGNKDTVTPPALVRKIAAARPDVEIHIIEDAGHAVYIEKRAEFDCLLKDFIAKI